MTLVVGKSILTVYRDKADELWSRVIFGIANPRLKSWADITSLPKTGIFGQTLNSKSKIY